MKRPANPHADKTCGTCRHLIGSTMYYPKCLPYCGKLSHSPPRRENDRACRSWKVRGEKPKP